MDGQVDVFSQLRNFTPEACHGGPNGGISPPPARILQFLERRQCGLVKSTVRSGAVLNIALSRLRTSKWLQG